ncbi:MAG: hypothetical protein ACQESE_00285 [Nanobdellota archaeon]
MKQRQYLSLTISLVVALILLTAFVSAVIPEPELTYLNGSSVPVFNFDRKGYDLDGQPYGSNSYMDHSITNPDVELSLCHQNLSVGDGVDLVYYSENKSLIASVLNYKPLITNVTTHADGNGTYNCTVINIDLSSTNALYPGKIAPVLIDNHTANTPTEYEFTQNSTELFEPLDPMFNGSYKIGVRVEGPPKTYYLFTEYIYDENKKSINSSAQKLVTSIVDSSRISVAEAILNPSDLLEYQDTFQGGEEVIVNGLSSLEIKMYDPCTPINESGYYIMNESIGNSSGQNLNDTCLELNNISNVVLNFGEEFVTGDDDSIAGSKKNDTCAFTIRNSHNITFESFKTYQFYYGICVENSSINIFGTQSSHNIHGAKITHKSKVQFIDTRFSNDDSEILVEDDSKLSLSHARFELENSDPLNVTHLDSEASNVRIRTVNPRPVIPNTTTPDGRELKDIGQYIRYDNLSSNNSFAQLTFHFREYAQSNLSEKVATDNISIYKYNGTMKSEDPDYVMSANESDGWINGNWSQIYTLVYPAEQLILSPNMSSFSVYAPLGFVTNNTNPEPVPEPTPEPTPDPVAGSDSGGGGTPSRNEFEDESVLVYPEPPNFELEIPDNVTLMQGEAGDISFNISNKGRADYEDVKVGPVLPNGWEGTNHTFSMVEAYSNMSATFSMASYEKALPGRYWVPIKVYVPSENGTTDVVTELLAVHVTPRKDLRRLKVVEYPPEVVVKPNSRLDISFLAKNIGDFNLYNITIEHEPEECIERIEGQQNISVGREKDLTYTFYFGDRKECDANLKFYSEEELVGFVPVSFKITPRGIGEFYLSTKDTFVLLVVIAWTILTIMIISRWWKRRKYHTS